MKLGCAVGVLRTGPAAGRLADIRSLGIDCIEPQFGDGAEDAENEKFLDETARELERLAMAVWSVHAPWSTEEDISSPDEATRTRGIVGAVRAARGCAALGGRVIVVHCGDRMSEDDPRRKEALARAAESVAKIVEGCAPLGVRVALENLPPDHLTSSAEELLSIVEQFPAGAVGVCLDTGHAHMASTLVEMIEQTSGRIITTHLHDNDRSGDQHLVPGAGTIDWRVVGAALARSSYDGPLMFEVSGPGSYAEALGRLAEAEAMIRAYMVGNAGDG